MDEENKNSSIRKEDLEGDLRKDLEQPHEPDIDYLTMLMELEFR